MKFEVMEITPDIAQAMLTKNTRNRKISWGTVDAYALDMANGNWDLNPQPISFDSAGNLMDGQHRLLAVIKSGISCKFVICTNAPLTYNIDNGRTRNVMNQLMMRGSAVPEEMINRQNVSIARFTLARKNGISRVTASQIEKFLFDHEAAFSDLRECVHKNNKLRGVSITPVMYALFSALHNNVEKDTVKKFYSLLVSGIGDGSELNNMVIRQRNNLINISNAKSLQDKMYYDEISRRIQKTIQLYASGKAQKSVYTPLEDVYAV